jgi:hypothetical protein
MPSLLFVGKAERLPLEWGIVMAHTCKFLYIIDLTAMNKHSSLLLYGTNNARKYIDCINPSVTVIIFFFSNKLERLFLSSSSSLF